MSRGGRGRGRGRGGSNSTRDAFNAAFAGMSKEDSRALFESFSRPTKGSGMMYPPLDKAAELPGPTELEDAIIKHTIAMARDLADGPAGEHGERKGAPWRLASERKVVGIEIESYSDRYRRQNQATPSGSTTLDASALHLNQSLFPPALWSEYFEGVSMTARASEAERARKRRRVLEGEDDGEGDEGEGEDEEEADDDFDFSEGEEDHQDYDANYFDNGEGDDDSAGEGGDDDGGRYDD